MIDSFTGRPSHRDPGDWKNVTLHYPPAGTTQVDANKRLDTCGGTPDASL
jgi:hypothetical protein